MHIFDVCLIDLQQLTILKNPYNRGTFLGNARHFHYFNNWIFPLENTDMDFLTRLPSMLTCQTIYFFFIYNQHKSSSLENQGC